MKLKFFGVVGAAMAMSLLAVQSVFAADPFASAINTATSTTVADYTAVLGDVIPVILGIIVLTMLWNRGKRLFR